MPEMVHGEWGRLVPPRDSVALGAAIRDVLNLPAEQRAEMGRSGREFVARRFAVRDEALKLIGLFERYGGPASS
jgi:glycosyltransferase involved in cell wall biosynthesis